MLANRFADHGLALVPLGLDPIREPVRTLDVERYQDMERHFLDVSPSGVRMMNLTASLQLNIDFGPEPARTWQRANAVAPLLAAAFANSPTTDGRRVPTDLSPHAHLGGHRPDSHSPGSAPTQLRGATTSSTLARFLAAPARPSATGWVSRPADDRRSRSSHHHALPTRSTARLPRVPHARRARRTRPSGGDRNRVDADDGPRGRRRRSRSRARTRRPMGAGSRTRDRAERPARDGGRTCSISAHGPFDRATRNWPTRWSRGAGARGLPDPTMSVTGCSAPPSRSDQKPRYVAISSTERRSDTTSFAAKSSNGKPIATVITIS